MFQKNKETILTQVNTKRFWQEIIKVLALKPAYQSFMVEKFRGFRRSISNRKAVKQPVQ